MEILCVMGRKCTDLEFFAIVEGKVVIVPGECEWAQHEQRAGYVPHAPHFAVLSPLRR